MSVSSAESPARLSRLGERELQRKRARDRRSQQAMRERTKSTVINLTQEVGTLSRALEERSSEISRLKIQVAELEETNEQLSQQNAALRLTRKDVAVLPMVHRLPLWAIPPVNDRPSCLTDELLQGLRDAKRQTRGLVASCPLEHDVGSLLLKDQRTDDEISNVVGDVVRSYAEIDSLPDQVAIHWLMSVLLKVGQEVCRQDHTALTDLLLHSGKCCWTKRVGI